MAGTAQADESKFFELEGFSTFLDGDPESTTLSEDGEVALPPVHRMLFEDVSRTIVDVAAWPDHSVALVWQDGVVERVDTKGMRIALGKSEGVVTASYAHPDGSLWLALTNPTRLVRIRLDKKNERTEMPMADVKYIWDMVGDGNGGVLMATGSPGRVMAIGKFAEKPRVLFKSEQEHLRSMAYDKALGIFVGGGSKGIVFRAEEIKSTFRAIYDTGHTEVTSMVIHGDQIFVAGVTGAATILENKATAKVASQVLALNMDGSSQTLAGSDDEVVFALAMQKNGTLLVATGGVGEKDPHGRIYGISKDKRRINMLLQVDPERIMWLVPSGKSIIAVTNGVAQVIEIGDVLAGTGTFLSHVLDAGMHAEFGRVASVGRVPSGTSVKLSLRTGQTSDPDATWSDWSERASPARFVQIRAELRGGGSISPAVYRLTLAYRRRNQAPRLQRVETLPSGVSMYPVYKPEEPLLGVDKKAMSKAIVEQRGLKFQSGKANIPGMQTVTWHAEDINGDTLRFKLEARVLPEGAWIVLGDRIENEFFSFESSRLPEGQVVFRVTASDFASNAVGEERDDQMVSRSIPLDRTAPSISKFSVDGHGNVVAEVFDAVGPLRDARVSVDGQDPRPMRPDDGLLDGLRETFSWKQSGLAPGSHTATLWVSDEAGNVGTAGATFVVR